VERGGYRPVPAAPHLPGAAGQAGRALQLPEFELAINRPVTPRRVKDYEAVEAAGAKTRQRLLRVRSGREDRGRAKQPAPAPTQTLGWMRASRPCARKSMFRAGEMVCTAATRAGRRGAAPVATLTDIGIDQFLRLNGASHGLRHRVCRVPRHLQERRPGDGLRTGAGRTSRTPGQHVRAARAASRGPQS